MCDVCVYVCVMYVCMYVCCLCVCICDVCVYVCVCMCDACQQSQREASGNADQSEALEFLFDEELEQLAACGGRHNNFTEWFVDP